LQRFRVFSTITAPNILHADQHQDNDANLFFMRVEWSLADFDLDHPSLREQFQPIAERFEMRWRLEYSDTRPAVAVFVSSHLHCLADVLYRHHAGEFACRIGLIVSNHVDAAALARFYEIPFHYMPIDRGSKERTEQRQLELLEQNGIDLIVLARYMQMLSPAFVARYPQRIINVHHSFLPAFSGGRRTKVLSNAVSN
jgi:formyltetrahydrofolate deformylase